MVKHNVVNDSVSMTTVSMAAQQQGETEKKLQSLKVEVERRDHDIRLLQTHLKDAEDILVSRQSPHLTNTLLAKLSKALGHQPNFPRLWAISLTFTDSGPSA